MVRQAFYLSTIRVNSELEALLLEARLVNKLQTKFNSQLKDDKHPLYIRITASEFPQVLTARKIDSHEKNLAFFGPYPSSKNVKNVLKMLRSIFPYAQHKPGKRGCFYSQIRLCNPCPSQIVKIKDDKVYFRLRKNYRKNITNIKWVLSGKLGKLRNSLNKQMDGYSKEENFEEAVIIRDRLRLLDYITQPITPIQEFLKNPNLVVDIRQEEISALEEILSQFYNLPDGLRRIECYDVAHISGAKPTASMVTFINGEADKTFYRHFRIRQEKGADDIASLREVAKRRIKHFSDWGIPNLILVDGGRGQVNVFNSVMQESNIPVVGLAKRFETLIIPQPSSLFKEIRVTGSELNLLQRLRNEAHRFARRYHHKLIQKSLIP